MPRRLRPCPAIALAAVLLVATGYPSFAQGIPPTVRPVLGFRYDAWSDVVAPLLSGRTSAEGEGIMPMAPLIPLCARVALSRSWTIDVGAKAAVRGSWIGEADPFWLFRGEAGLSWWPFDAFGTGPVLGAAAWSEWTLRSGDACFMGYGLRTDAGINLSLGRVGSLYSGIAFKAPLSGAGRETPRTGLGGFDLVIAWMVML